MALGTVSSLFTPAPYEGVNTNGMWIGLSSPTYDQRDFKYIISLKKTDIVTGATNTSLGTYKFPPNPTDGNGYFSPHRILKSHLANKIYAGVATSSIPFTQSVWTSPNAQVRYSYQYGFELAVNIPFVAITGAGVNEVTLSFDVAHKIIAGDIIKIVKRNANIEGYINGIATVMSTTTFTLVANYTNTPTVAGPALPVTTDTGFITYVSRYTGYVDYSSRGNDYLYAFDAVTPATYSYDEHAFYLKTTQDSESNLLTDWVEPRYILLNESETVSYISDNGEAVNRIDNIKYTVYGRPYPDTSLQNYITTVPTLLSSSRYRHHQVVTGTNEVLLITGSPHYNDLHWYKVELLGPTFSGSPVRGTIIRILDKTDYCNRVRICWLNKKGGWDFFTFTYLPTSKTSIVRNEIKTLLPFNYNVKYNTGNRQTNIFSMNTETTYMVQSDWLTETEYERLNQILESPEVFILDGVDYTKTSSSTTPIVKVTPIIAVNREYESKATINDNLFNLKLEYKIAYDTVLHNR